MTSTAASKVLGLTRQSMNKKIRAGVFDGVRRLDSLYVLPEESVFAVKQQRDADEVVES